MAGRPLTRQMISYNLQSNHQLGNVLKLHTQLAEFPEHSLNSIMIFYNKT